MPKYSIAGRSPVNIIIEAETENKAIELARAGEGYIEQCPGLSIEIEDNPSISNLDE